MPRSYKKYFTRALLLVSTALYLSLASTGVVKAISYGSGPYGKCAYQTGCPASTQITLPSGLEVNINLHDGQEIPEEGYTIIVTPLNGQGTTFKQADFYINGALVHSQAPAEDGTVRWLWIPLQYPGNVVKITVTGQDGQTVTHEFHVVIVKKGKSAIPASGGLIPPSRLKQIIHNLPNIVKNSLPYFLFLLLLVDILLVIVQIRREVRESRALRAVLEREKRSGQLKSMMTSLISHYLRTPLTIIGGAVELGNSQDLPPPLAASLKKDVLELNARVDNLITEASNANTVADISEVLQITRSKAIWLRPLFFLPILLVGILAFYFDYLVTHAGSFSISQANLTTQIILFVTLATLLYVTTRRLDLRRRDIAETKHILTREINFNKNRDELIETTAHNLSGGMSSLDGHIAQLNASSKASTMMREGQKQFHDVVGKCVIASKLKGASSGALPEQTLLSKICFLGQTLQAKALAKGVSVDIAQDTSITVRSPVLLSFVMQTVLDNAIEFSPPQGHIEVTGHQEDGLFAVTVTDHGPGIAQDKKFTLFQAFSKVDAAEVSNHPGPGFSLYLDKLIMTYLLGDISVAAASPHGTKVVLSLTEGGSA